MSPCSRHLQWQLGRWCLRCLASQFLQLVREDSTRAVGHKLTSVHKMNAIQAASNVLDASQCEGHVFEKGLGRIADVLVLPVGESISKPIEESQFCEGWWRGSRSYARSMPLRMTESMEPLAHKFQLSAVPTKVLG